MPNTYYEILAGSRSYDLNVPDSDIDICRATDFWDLTSHDGNIHFIQMPREEFIARTLCKRDSVYYIQWMFPAKVNTPGEIERFMMENREQIILAQPKRIFELHMTAADGFALYPEHYYGRFPKRLAYSTLFYDTIARYAKGAPFAEAIRPEEDLRQQLLAMRLHEMPLEAAVKLNENAKKRALAVADWYDATTDEEKLKAYEQELFGLLKLKKPYKHLE